jgi:hypothetical protein
VDPVKPEPPTNIAWESVTYAEEQAEYQNLPVLRERDTETCSCISAWRLTEEEVKYIRDCEAAGVPAVIHLEQMVFRGRDGKPQPLQPVRLAVGDPQWEGWPWTPRTRQ